jgi:hypothetical protein
MRSSDASGPKKPPLCHEKACIEPAITRAAGVKTLHQTQVAIAESVGRFVAAAFWPVGLFDQARVMDQYRFTAICNEWQIDIAPAKPSWLAFLQSLAGVLSGLRYLQRVELRSQRVVRKQEVFEPANEIRFHFGPRKHRMQILGYQ